MKTMQIVLTADSYEIVGKTLVLRPARADLHDGCIVTGWRNESTARAAFWSQRVVTPDSHVAFMRNKSPYDMVWIAEAAGQPIGMVGLIVDPETHSGEAGRYYVASQQRHNGYGKELDFMVLAFGFEYLQLADMWLDAWCSNQASIETHLSAGWHTVGIDVAGHCRLAGSVLHMAITAEQWRGLEFAK